MILAKPPAFRLNKGCLDMPNSIMHNTAMYARID